MNLYFWEGKGKGLKVKYQKFILLFISQYL